MPNAKASPKARVKTTNPSTRTSSKVAVSSSEDVGIEAVRQLKRPEYRSFRISKRIKHHKPRIIGSVRLARQSIGVLWRRRVLFAGIVAVYVLLVLVLVRGFSGGSVTSNLKDLVDQLTNADAGKVVSGLTIFSVLVGTAGSTQSESAGVYRSLLLLVVSLAIIWALRQSVAGIKVRIRDAYYKGMYPAVTFILVLLVVAIQLLPMVVAGFLYGILFTSGVAATGLEQVLWGLLLSLLILWSMYMITSSVFALYIVTLPDMTPMKALRSARGLVRYRRWTIMRRLIFLPIALLLLMIVIMAPFIFFWTGAAEWVFFLLSTSMILIVHSYMYNLYRELIK